MITLVLGGARSGKSSVAERLAEASTAGVVYVATGIVTDDDMAERIEVHRRRRPAAWATIETSEVAAAVRASSGGAVLVDSLTTWVAAAPDFDVDLAGLARALADHDADAIVVSDEGGLGVHPEPQIGRRFRDALGTVNRGVGDVADDVLFVVAGRTLRLS